MGNSLAIILVPVAVAATFAFARKHLAASTMRPPQGEYLNIPFGGTTGVNACIVFVGVVFAFATHAALVSLNRYVAGGDGQAEFRLWPQSAIWWFFPGFGAVSLSWEIVFQIWANFGNRWKAYAYNYWWAQAAGFDSTRWLRWMAVLLTVPIGILTFLALPIHVTLGPNDIRDCGYAFAPCQTYRYSDARRMTAVQGFRNRQGALVSRAGIVIDFNDGRRWSSADIGDFKDTVDPALASYLESRTHLLLHYAQAAADVPRY